jgi:hypothetical protein
MSDTPRTDRAANESIVRVYETSMQLERELAETIAQRDELLEAIERYLPFVPDMEPIGAAKHAEANLAAWNLRQVIPKLKGESHE